MIQRTDLVEIGSFLKPHGIKGELTFMPTTDVDIMQLHCIMTEVDGLMVPFFPKSIRSKGHELKLVLLDDIDDEKQAAELSNRPVYALANDVEIEEDEEGYGAETFIGFTVIDTDNSHPVGKIEYIDDSNENWLFMVQTNDNTERKNLIAIPIADELITSIDTDAKTIGMSLPEGLLDL